MAKCNWTHIFVAHCSWAYHIVSVRPPLVVEQPCCHVRIHVHFHPDFPRQDPPIYTRAAERASAPSRVVRASSPSLVRPDARHSHLPFPLATQYHHGVCRSPHCDRAKQRATKMMDRLRQAADQPREWVNMYGDFITKNGSAVGQVEGALRSLTYIIPGMFRSRSWKRGCVEEGWVFGFDVAMY